MTAMITPTDSIQALLAAIISRMGLIVGSSVGKSAVSGPSKMIVAKTPKPIEPISCARFHWYFGPEMSNTKAGNRIKSTLAADEYASGCTGTAFVSSTFDISRASCCERTSPPHRARPRTPKRRFELKASNVRHTRMMRIITSVIAL